MSPPSRPDPSIFLSDGGEVGRLMRGMDWAAHPLGPVAGWPPALRSMVAACLNSPMLGTVLWGPELRMLYNDAYIPSMGERHPWALGRPVAQVWGSAWEAVSPAFFEVLRTGRGMQQQRVPLPIERHGRRVDTWWDFTATPIRDESGAIVGLLNQGSEITDRVLAEQRRDAAEADLRALTRELAARVEERTRDRNALWTLSSDLMLRCRFDGEMVAVNPAWTDLLGWTPEQLVGHSVFELIHPDDVAPTREGAQAASQGRPLVALRNRYRHRDGSYRHIEWNTRSADGLINAVGRNVTEVEAQAAALAASQEQLRQSQKLEAIGQLTGGVAHDFNNLLAGITGSLELLRRRVAEGRLQDIDRLVTMGLGAARRAAALTHRLLAFARRQTLAPKALSVNRLVVGMEELVRRALGPGITLRVVLGPELWTTLADPHQVENALLNLCINARDAMPGGGTLTITTANRHVLPGEPSGADVAPGAYVCLSVADDGMGMPPDVVARAFEPFFTTKPMGMGTGLGLSMIYGFAKQSGGGVEIRSCVGQGTRVCLYLPRHEGLAADDPAPAEAQPMPRARGSRTVLVVDDDAPVRGLVAEVVEEMGYHVLQAPEAAAALQLLRSDAAIHLMVTDVGLPGGMNGRELADAAQALRPALKVLFITGYAENAVFGGLQPQPGLQVLTKPFELAALAAQVDGLMAGAS
ncbi:MAG: ATP-binding protein [Aquincola tertiaricarbonis]